VDVVGIECDMGCQRHGQALGQLLLLLDISQERGHVAGFPLGGGVQGNAHQLVVDERVVEAVFHSGSKFLAVVLVQRKNGNNFLQQHLVHVAQDGFVVHAVTHNVEACQVSTQNKTGVCAVQDANLALLIRAHIGGNKDVVFQTSLAERQDIVQLGVALNDPHAENLANVQQGVSVTVLLFKLGNFLPAGGGGARANHGVERFVQLSTDKAVNPTSVMGCTKRICEMLIQTFAGNTDMKCVAVRFGNVLGSHGSVIPLFEAQIKKGGPVTLTDPNIERYFMTIPEAAQLVLQAGALAESGNIYVLDMGEPVKIMDLAKQLIRFYGYEPGVNMEIKIVGLRPGEKLYEELMMDEEQDKMRRTQHNKIFVASPRSIDLAEFYGQLQELAAAAEHNDEGVVQQLAKMIPTFTPTRQNLKL